MAGKGREHLDIKRAQGGARKGHKGAPEKGNRAWRPARMS